MSNIDTQPFPRFALIAAALLVSGSIAAAAVARYVRVNGAEASQAQSMSPLAVRDLTFFDMADGSVEVRDASGADVLFVAEPGTNGFIRGVMRGMARDRRARQIGQAPAFRLAEWPDGRLSLEDTATGKQIELGAFGATNRAAFAQLLAARAGAAS
ncbi:MAG: photosynthetic complex assembly protein PuhC [Hyphomonadaceae bacterium]|nr:photosynthetic complex assembly protein PuhC [Hyphomonadaceae bacterium]